MKNKTNILEKVKLFFQVYGANYYIGVEHSSEDKNKIQNLFHNYGCLPRIGLFEEVNETFFKFQTSLARFTEGINCYHFVDLTFNENKLEEEDSEKKAKEKTKELFSNIKEDKNLIRQKNRDLFFNETKIVKKLSFYAK